MLNASSRGGRVVAATFAFLLVTAALGPFVTPASAQSQTFEQTFTGSPGFVTVDQTDISGPYTVEVFVSSSEVPDYSGGQVQLLEWQSNGDKGLNKLLFKNGQVYQNVTVKVTIGDSGSGEPTFGSGSGVFPISELIGNNGGDANLRCGNFGALEEFVTGGTKNVDCTTSDYPTINNTDTDANQTKVDIYESALAQDATANTSLTTMENYLQDTRTVALMEGKNAYIRALNNGSAEAVARSKAKQAVSQYYIKKQRNLIHTWNVSLRHIQYLNNASLNESGISSGYISVDMNWEDTWPGQNAALEGFGVSSVTLANGSTVNAVGYQYEAKSGTFTLTDSPTTTDFSDYGGTERPKSFEIKAPDTNFDNINVVDFSRYRTIYANLNTQNDEVQAEIDTFVNNTYSEYQSGQINESDLVDPYLGARSYSPQDGFQTWALSTFQSLGVDGPSNLSDIGHMTVVDNSTNSSYQGILMSDGLPQNGTFEVGTTYNASNITGTQFVITTDQKHELDGRFTITEAVTTDGTNLTNVTYRNVSYNTSDISEYESLIQELSDLRAAIESREDTLGGGGGGGFSFGDVGSQGIAIVALAGAGLYLLGENRAN